MNYSITDDSTFTNTIYGTNKLITLTGDGAKTAIGEYSNITSSSTTADNLTVLQLSTNVTGIITSGNRFVYGLYSNPRAGAESTGGATNVYGGILKADGDVAEGGTLNAYGLYVDNGSYDTQGNSTAYGVYIEPISGADNNYALCLDCDGTWSANTVAAGIQFGTDANGVNLYRSASDTLRTDDSLYVEGDFTVIGSCTGCGGAPGGSSNWTLSTANGTINPNNNTLDLLVGGTSTQSAVFSVLGGCSRYQTHQHLLVLNKGANAGKGIYMSGRRESSTGQ